MIRAFGLGVSVSLAAACLVALACGAGGTRSSAPPAAPSASATPEVASEDPHIVIEQLDRDISDKAARAQVLAPSATCSGAACATAMSEPFTTPAVDPACRAGGSDRCSNVCTLAASICRSQERICKLAQRLPDNWAANKCIGARASCQAAHDNCCSCMQGRRSPGMPI